MTNDFEIKAGINQYDKNILKELSLYVRDLEQKNNGFCRKLNYVVENDPKVLFEPIKIDQYTDFPIRDLAFIYNKNEITGHLICIFKREKTDFGYKTNIEVEEEYISNNIPDNYFEQYVTERLKGNLFCIFNENEKNNQK